MLLPWLNGNEIKKTMNVLGFLLDSKLQWAPQVVQTITKAKRALHAIKLINPYCTNDELKTLITSNFYVVLSYNSEIWHIPTMKSYLKQQLLSASAQALRLCMDGDTSMSMISFINLHKINNRATPEQYMYYKHSFQL